MSDRQGYKDCTQNPGEYRIPVPAQNIIYREYAKKIIILKLSINELFFPGFFLELQENLLNELTQLDGIKCVGELYS